MPALIPLSGENIALSSSTLFFVSLVKDQSENPSQCQQDNHDAAPELAVGELVFNGGYAVVDFAQPLLETGSPAANLLHIYTVEQAMKLVAQGEDFSLHLPGVDPQTVQSGHLLFQVADHPVGGHYRRLDFFGAAVGMAAGTIPGIYQVRRSIHHVMVAVACDALRSAVAERPAVGAGKVILLDPDVAATTEVGDRRFRRFADEAPRGAHCHGHVGRVAAVTIVAGDAVGGVDALPPKPDRFARLRFLSGTWRGDQAGQPGRGTAERTYQFILNDRFLQETNTSTYPPQEKNKNGEVHHHMSMISYDTALSRLTGVTYSSGSGDNVTRTYAARSNNVASLSSTNGGSFSFPVYDELNRLRQQQLLGRGLLVALQLRLAKKGESVRLVHLSPHIRELFRLSGLDSVVPIE